MENQGRNLARHQCRSEAIAKKKNTKKKEPVTIIFMKKVGGIYTTRVSGKLVLFAGLFLAVFIAFSVWVINNTLDIYFENQVLKVDLAAARKTLEEYQFQSQVLTQYNQLVTELENTDPDLKNVAPKEIEEEASGTVKKSEAAMEPVVSESEKTMNDEDPARQEKDIVKTEAGPQAPENPPVDAIQLTLRPERSNSSVSFQYNLRNITPDNEAVSGYVFFVLTNPGDDKGAPAVFPEVEFVNGQPSDYKKGTQFSIRHGKTVRGRLDGLNDAEKYNNAWVYAYSDEGELILKKNIPSDNG